MGGGYLGTRRDQLRSVLNSIDDVWSGLENVRLCALSPSRRQRSKLERGAPRDAVHSPVSTAWGRSRALASIFEARDSTVAARRGRPRRRGRRRRPSAISARHHHRNASCAHKAHIGVIRSVPASVPKPGPRTIIRQPTPTKFQLRNGPEIIDFRPVLEFLAALANRRLQPLGHLTAREC